MSVGWYLKADGTTHELHEAGRWTGLTMPDELTNPAAWEGHPLGSVDAEDLAHAIRGVLKLVEAANIELHFGEDGIRVSTQGPAGELFASFLVPVRDPDLHGFTCLISASDARILTEFNYPHMFLRLGSTEQWCPSLIASSESGVASEAIECLRIGAPGNHDRRRTEAFGAGAILDPLALQAALGRLSSQQIDVSLSPNGVRLSPFDSESGAMGDGKDVQTIGVAGDAANGVFNRGNLLVFVAEVERAAEQLELSITRIDSARYLGIAPYGVASISGWYQQKEED